MHKSSVVFRVAFAAAASALIVSCGGTTSSDEEGSGAAPGSIATNPDAAGGFTRFIVDTHQGGAASQMLISSVSWGRLVEVHALDPLSGERTPIFRELVVDPTVRTDGIDYLLERSPVLGRDVVVVLHAFGSSGWDAAFARLESALPSVQSKGISPSELPPFSMVPRNAALVVRFDDLLNDGGTFGSAGYPGSVVSENVQVAVGYPPTTRFEARTFPDPNHGDLKSGKFHSTRVIVDMTVSVVESLQANLPTNAVGLPAALQLMQPNVAVRIPTLVNPLAAQFSTLTNLSGHPLAFIGGGPVDPASPTLDVVRGLRSGGKSAVTGDPYNGFLQDLVAPRVVGAQPIGVIGVTPTGVGSAVIDLSFQASSCQIAPRVGDLLALAGGAFAEVQGTGTSPVAGIVSGVAVRTLVGSSIVPGPGELMTAFDPARGDPPECFVTISPRPTGGPLTMVSPASSFEVRFSEPMDPDSVDPFETFKLSNPAAPTNQNFDHLVVADSSPVADLDSFTLQPTMPLSHTSGVAEPYDLHLVGGLSGATDLAGNPLVADLGVLRLALDSTAPTLVTGGASLRFNSVDENGDGLPEMRGQVLPNLLSGELAPRGVSRWSAEVNNTLSSAPTAMVMGGGAAVIDPFPAYGSRVMSLWRYHDLGLDLMDDATHNVDVEGLHWTPQGSVALFDFLPRFGIAFAHSRFLPDEALDSNGAAQFPMSGMVADYHSNLLDPVEDPLTSVHDDFLGYAINPLESFDSVGGITMVPFPLNRNIPLSEYKYWTWRDTSILAVGGPNGQGVDTAQLIAVTGEGTVGAYGAGAVPTIGLPLLVELRAYPNSSIQGFNLARVLVPNSAPSPSFRAVSSGFVPPSGPTQIVNPDQLTSAIGSQNTLGLPTPPTDKAVYEGQVDFVVRVSRAHTIWMDAGAASSFGPAEVVQTVPAGTSIQVEFRGATGIVDPNNGLVDATMYDPYGDYLSGSVLFMNSDPTWKQNLPQLDGSRYIQARITFTANVEAGVTPRISALGIPFSQ